VSVVYVLFHAQYEHIISVLQNMDYNMGYLQVLDFLSDKIPREIYGKAFPTTKM
jgi:hypothetical protein